MTNLDLFSGIGGFHLGLLEAGIKPLWCGYSEINKYAKQIYKKHFPDSEDLGDVKTIRADRLPKLDLITFGFPCQDLSIAGKRAGIQASRSNLFFEAMRIVRDARPTYFIFENVKGLFSSSNGECWKSVLKEIASAGYDGQWQLLNTRWFLPQNRERIYFVGHIRGESRPQIFPIGENGSKNNKTSTQKKSSSNKIANSLTSHYAKNQHGNQYVVDTKKQGKPRFSIDCPTLQETNYKDPMKVSDGIKIRRLTPLECERLQGFPDGWTEGISDTQRYKCLGNAVSIPVVAIILKRLKLYLEELALPSRLRMPPKAEYHNDVVESPATSRGLPSA